MDARTHVFCIPREIHGGKNEGTEMWLPAERVWTKEDVAGLKSTFQKSVSRFVDFAKGKSNRGLAYALVATNGSVETLEQVGFTGDQRVLTLVVGRHSHADSSASAASLALRHVLLVQTRLASHRVQVHDLRSDFGTTTVSGEAFVSGAAELPLALILGPYLLLVCETGTDPLTVTTFIERATTASVVKTPATPLNETFRFDLESLAAAPDASSQIGLDADKTGAWVIPQSAAQASCETFRPTDRHLAEGVLIGRYTRCAWPTNKTAGPGMLSRVHAIVFSVMGETFIADLASTNGLKHDTLGELRYKHLQSGDVFWLSPEYRLTVTSTKPLQ